MRISSSAALLLCLAACGSSDDAERSVARAEANEAAQAADAGEIECAPAGAAFKRVCALDRVAGVDGTTLVVHNPDGGFHRLRVTTDGRGVIAADGAEQARVTVIADDRIEVAIGRDRYRLPATIKGGAATS